MWMLRLMGLSRFASLVYWSRVFNRLVSTINLWICYSSDLMTASFSARMVSNFLYSCETSRLFSSNSIEFLWVFDSRKVSSDI